MDLSKYRFTLTSALNKRIEHKQESSVEESLKAARQYLNVLVQTLEEILEESVKQDEARLNYDNNNWNLVLADNLGYRRALRKVINIIGPTEEE